MKLALSRGIERAFPGVAATIHSTWAVARSLDPDIPFEGIYVYGRCGPGDGWSGWAHPRTWTHDQRWGRDERIFHPHGRVDLMIGSQCDCTAVIRLCAHEFRHLGQFIRGRKEYGELTITPMNETDSESDAYWFEEVVLTEMRSLAADIARITVDVD